MFSTFISYFTGGSIVKWIVGGIVGIVAGGLLYTVHDYQSQATTIQKQKDQISSLQASLKVEQSNKAAYGETIISLNARLAALQEPGEDLEAYCDAMAAANKAPDAKEPAGSAIGEALKKVTPAPKKKK